MIPGLMDHQAPKPLSTDQAVPVRAPGFVPVSFGAGEKGQSLLSHVMCLCESPSVENIGKLLNFLDHPDVQVRRALCACFVTWMRSEKDPKMGALLQEGLAVLQRDENPIVRLYLAQLLRS